MGNVIEFIPEEDLRLLVEGIRSGKINQLILVYYDHEDQLTVATFHDMDEDRVSAMLKHANAMDSFNALIHEEDDD